MTQSDIHAGYATRPHTCAICGRVIAIGEMVERWLRAVAHVGCALRERLARS